MRTETASRGQQKISVFSAGFPAYSLLPEAPVLRFPAVLLPDCTLFVLFPAVEEDAFPERFKEEREPVPALPDDDFFFVFGFFLLSAIQ